MKKLKVKLKIDGSIIEGDYFDNNDYSHLKQIFNKWKDINNNLKLLGGRSLNVPDVLSEGLYCIFFGAIRTNGTAYSYDAVDISTGEGIQIKSASIPNDCTSFGPKSKWDKLYFLDFVPNGKVDGNIWFYEIDSKDIDNIVLNQTGKETFKKQQNQRRRPRFSIKNKIIRPKNLKPVKMINLFSDEINYKDIEVFEVIDLK